MRPMHLPFTIAASTLLLVAGCATAAKPTLASRSSPFAIELKPAAAGPGRVVAWSVRVRTGGFTLTTDRVVVVDGTMLRVFATLETPAPNAIVAQAFATLTGESNVGEPSVATAELSVRRVERGTAAETVAYEVVATSP